MPRAASTGDSWTCLEQEVQFALALDEVGDHLQLQASFTSAPKFYLVVESSLNS